MKCPHCLVSFHEAWNVADTGQDGEYLIRTWWTNCPSCGRLTLMFAASEAASGVELHRWMAHPRVIARSPLDEVIPEKFREDCREATIVLTDSPKASAALSRRCLQAVLRREGFTQSRLVDQIDAAMPTLPGYVADPLHYVRDLGNIAAHETTNKTTGEIVDVEPGEAEALLGVLDDLFDHYYVKPEQARVRAEALQARKSAPPPPNPAPEAGES